MKETLLILLVMISASCSGKTTDGKTMQQVTRSHYIMEIVDSIISNEPQCQVDVRQSEISRMNVGKLYDVIAKNEGSDGGKILFLKRNSEIYEKIQSQDGDTIFIFDYVYIRPESGINLKTYVFSPSESFMSYNGERAYKISDTKISGLKSWINQNSRNVQSRPNGDGASYVAGYLFQVVVQNNELNVTKCPTIPSIAVSSTKSPELLNNVMDSVYQTSWLTEEIGNRVMEKLSAKKRNSAFNRLSYNQLNDDVYFVEDLYNYECWALWSQKELIYCYNGQINVYSKPSANVEKLFDNFLEEDISAVLSDKTINIFPHRKKFKSTFFVAKISIRDSHPSIIYVKRFQGFF